MSNQSTFTHLIELRLVQSVPVLANMEGFMSRLRKYNPLDILTAIAYVVIPRHLSPKDDLQLCFKTLF